MQLTHTNITCPTMDPNKIEQIPENELLMLQNAFLNNIMHEIRTPLNAIIGCSDIISMPDTDRETVGEMSVQLRRYSSYLLKMIDNIVIMSKIQAGLIKVSPSKFDVLFLATYIYHSSRSLVVTDPAKNGKVSYTLVNNLGDKPVLVWADDRMICQVANALVDNAIKFTDEGSVRLSAAVTAHQGKNESDYILEIKVSDTGTGIAPENGEIIFDKFKKVSPDPSRIYDGAGLGLAIAKAQTEMMNGSLTFKSKVGEGTEFTLRVPVTRC